MIGQLKEVDTESGVIIITFPNENTIEIYNRCNKQKVCIDKKDLKSLASGLNMIIKEYL